ncbi:MAG: MATE family efflux transporter [Emergencia sp.]
MSDLQKKTYEIDMVRGPVLLKMLRFSLPLMMSSILQLLFNAADIIVVGRFAGDNALAAVGSNTSLITLLTNLFVGLSVGANVAAARYYGARRPDELKETVHTTMMMGLLSGLLLTVIGIIGSRRFLIWMGTPDEVLPLAAEYLRIYFLGMTGMMLYNFGSAILRAVGDTRRPLYFLAFSGCINVGLNLLLVIVFDMSVAGVGIATAASQWISAILIIQCLMREKGAIHLSLRQLSLHMDKAAAILRVGLPAGLQGMIFSITNVMIQSAVNSFGATVVAGSSAAANIEGFIYFAMNAFYQATISFTSQNVGARRIKRVDKILSRGELCVIVVGMVMGLLAVTFGRQLLGIYSSSEAVIDAGMERLRIIAMTYALGGAMDVMVGALRGMGYSVVPMIVTLVGVCGLRVFWILTVFQMPQFHTVQMLFITYPITWTVTVTGHIITFFIVRKKLREKAVARQL